MPLPRSRLMSKMAPMGHRGGLLASLRMRAHRMLESEVLGRLVGHHRLVRASVILDKKTLARNLHFMFRVPDNRAKDVAARYLRWNSHRAVVIKQKQASRQSPWPHLLQLLQSHQQVVDTCPQRCREEIPRKDNNEPKLIFNKH